MAPAKRSGGKPRRPYHHGNLRRALLDEALATIRAVAVDGFRTLRQQLVTAWEEGGRGDAAFHAMGLAYVRFAVANPSHYRVMFGGLVDPQAQDAPDPELAAEGEGAFRALVDALAALQHDAVFRSD